MRQSRDIYSSMLNSDTVCTVYTHSLILELKVEFTEQCVKKCQITVASKMRADMLSECQHSEDIV